MPAPPLPQPVWEALPVEARVLVEAMRLQIDSLQAEVRSLKDRLDSHSRNSSRPPAADPIHLKRQPPRPPSGKKRGGQPGHQRASRPLVPPEQLTDTITCKPAACSGCGATLDGSDPRPIRPQVAEVPPIRPEVIEYQLHRLTCPGCGVTTRGPLPEGVPTGSFGPRLRATLSLLAAEFRLAKRPIPRLARTLLGLDIRLGMIAKLERQTAVVLGPVDEELAEAVRSAPAAHIDETPWRQANTRAWLWVGPGAGVTHSSSSRRTAATCHHLLGGEAHLWRFLASDGVEPTNNPAERALRHGVIWRKTSGGTASVGGSQFVSRLLGVVATCRQRGRLVLDYLTSCFEASIRSQPVPSLLHP